MGEYCRKGNPIYVEGRLKLETWDDKQSGQKRSKMKVVGEQIQFLGSRQREEDRGSDHDHEEQQRPRREEPRGGRPQQQPARRPAAPPPRPPVDPDLDAADDDIPF